MKCDCVDHDRKLDGALEPFPPNAIAYSTVRVVMEGRPIRSVAHDRYGEWQLLHGDLQDDDRMAQICLACAVKRDSSLVPLSDLPVGWIATRASRNKPWKREPLEAPSDPVWVRVLDFLVGPFRRTSGKK